MHECVVQMSLMLLFVTWYVRSKLVIIKYVFHICNYQKTSVSMFFNSVSICAIPPCMCQSAHEKYLYPTIDLADHTLALVVSTSFLRY